MTFVLGFLSGLVCTVGLAGLLVALLKPWRLTSLCDEVVSRPRPERPSHGHMRPPKLTIE